MSRRGAHVDKTVTASGVRPRLMPRGLRKCRGTDTNRSCADSRKRISGFAGDLAAAARDVAGLKMRIVQLLDGFAAREAARGQRRTADRWATADE